MSTSRPHPSEYNDYYNHYIDLVESDNLYDALKAGKERTATFFEGLAQDKHHYRYAEGKWTPKEVLLHLIDTERVFSYRALHFARAQNVVLPGFDQNVFVDNSDANNRSMSRLLEEYVAVRSATLLFGESCSEETFVRMGTASNNPFSVRALLYIIAGHEIHHCKIISERYL